jgi:acyl-CoA reductase-like NAD-dependent aldehyde dehydrogenase
MTSDVLSVPSGLLIGGERITDGSGGTHAHIYPATGRPNAHIRLAGPDDIDRAVASAWEAHREWMSLTVDRRRDLLVDLADAVRENLDDLARLNVHDYAVPISFAGNAILLERFLRHFAGYVDKLHGATTPVTGSSTST